MPLTTLAHPLAKHLLTALRDQDTPPEQFRPLATRLTSLLLIQATSDLPLEDKEVETPLERYTGAKLARGLVAVPILRAGLGMLEPALSLFPDVSVGYIGLERDEVTAHASSYYLKLPPLADREVLLLDPMLATGGSAVRAIEALIQKGAADIRFVCIVAAPEGVDAVHRAFPQVKIYAAALDRCLNEKKYIVPGLGDFGDRLFGT